MEVLKKKETFEGKRFPFKTGLQSHVPHLVRAHWHEHLEFIRILQEPVTLYIDNQTFETKTGDIYFINSNQIHSADTRDTPAGSGLILGMVFDKALLYAAADTFELRQAFSAFSGSNTLRNHFPSADPLWPELKDAMDRALEAYDKLETAYELSVLSCIYRMVAPLLRLHRPAPHDGDPEKRALYYHRLRPAVDYMERHFERKVYMEEVCRTVNLSPYHFSTLFKQVFGLPPVQYLTRHRIEQAKRLLIERDIPVTAIAERCGFCNINYFDKVFKEQSGFTPIEYRRRFVPSS